jgi:phosphohistidine phosphatase
MRRLLLLRHGEAENAAPGGNDFERALTGDGRAEVQAAADVIAKTGLPIDRVLVSPARRTLETASIIAAQVRLARPPEPQQKLYLAQPLGLVQALEHCQASARTVLLIGHNPGLSELAERLTAGDEPVSLRTAGICLLSFNSDGWRDLAADVADECRLLR